MMGIALTAGLLFAACTEDQYTITVVADPVEGGTVTGGGTYDKDASVQLTATPNDGYEFSAWADDATAAATRTITVSESATFTAKFEKINNDPTINVTFDELSWQPEKVFAYYNTNSTLYLQAHRQNSTRALDWLLATNVAVAGGTSTIDGSNLQYSPNDIFSRLEYYKNDTLTLNYTDGTQRNFGDYWAQTATVNVKSFDATTHKATIDITATMFRAHEAYSKVDGHFVGLDSVTTFKNMSIKVNKYTFENAPSKKGTEEMGDFTTAVRQ